MESNEFKFEQAIERLEKIVESLDSGELSLDDSLKLFEKGITLARKCSKQLNEAQGKIEQLIKKPDGALETEPLEAE